MKNTTEIIDLVATLLTGGFLLFLATQLIKRDTWAAWLKIVLSMVLAAVFAVATAWLRGDVWNLLQAWGSLTAADVLAFGTLLWTTATLWYRVVFKDAAWAKALGSWPKRN